MSGHDAIIRAFRRRLIEYGVLIRGLNDRLQVAAREKSVVAAAVDQARFDAAILGNRVHVLESRLSSRLTLLKILLGLNHPTRDEEVDARLEIVSGAAETDGVYRVAPLGGEIELRGWLKGPATMGGPAFLRIGTRMIACKRFPRADVAGTFGLDPTIGWGFSALLSAADVPTTDSVCWILVGDRQLKCLGRLSRSADSCAAPAAPGA